jgi:hypothetical protein
VIFIEKYSESFIVSMSDGNPPAEKGVEKGSFESGRGNSNPSAWVKAELVVCCKLLVAPHPHRYPVSGGPDRKDYASLSACNE